MPKIPFSSQILPVDYLLSAQIDIKAGKPVSGEELLRAIEQSIQQQLPETARDLVRRAVVPAVKARGRPIKFGAALDLALETVDRRYAALLRHEQRKKDRLLKTGKGVSKADYSPSLLAYDRLLQHMKDAFGPMTPEALRNMHSAWRNGHFHASDNQIDSEDFEAEIESQFPTPQQRS